MSTADSIQARLMTTIIAAKQAQHLLPEGAEELRAGNGHHVRDVQIYRSDYVAHRHRA